MFAEFGPAPLCLELDFDSFDGPSHWVSRFRRMSGWMLVAKATIQSEHDILTAKLVAACDEQENPIPAFKALNLLHCDWINPTYCDELPPEVLDDLICEQEGELVRRWHREKNAGLAEAFEAQEQRIAELEGRVGLAIRQNEHRIAELRQRRRHPDATPEMRAVFAGIIGDLSDENDELVAEMAETREAIRVQAEAAEEALWSREDLLIEVETLHLIRWTALASAQPQTRSYFLADRVSETSHELISRFDLGSGDRHWARRHVPSGMLKLIPLTSSVTAPDLQPSEQSNPVEHPTRGMESAPHEPSPPELDRTARTLYACLAKALAKAERLALVVQRSHPDDPYLQYNQRQQAANAKQIMLLEGEIARLPSLTAPDAELGDEETAPCRSDEDRFHDRRERRELEDELGDILQRWVEVAEARASAPAGSTQAALADTALHDLRGRLREVETRRDEIGLADARETGRRASQEVDAEPQTDGPWTDAKVAELTRLWTAGVPVGQIAKELGDTSRNAVIGKASRLGLAKTHQTVNADCAPSEPLPTPPAVQNALSALAAAQARYYGRK